MPPSPSNPVQHLVEIFIKTKGTGQVQSDMEKTVSGVQDRWQRCFDALEKMMPQNQMKAIADEMMKTFTTIPIADFMKMTSQEILKLQDPLQKVSDLIAHTGYDRMLPKDLIEKFHQYNDLLKETSERIHQNNREHLEQVTSIQPKVENFLGRYKYSLLLIGGALTAVYGQSEKISR